MHRTEITIQVDLDDDKMPETIQWKAPDGGMNEMASAKGLLLGLWDGEEKSALRIDLWTKKMQMDEMVDFFYQSLMGMADTYERATRNEDLAKEMKAFAKSFNIKALKALEKEA